MKDNTKGMTIKEKLFGFEDMCTKEEDFEEVVRELWEDSGTVNVAMGARLKFYRELLKD